MIIRHSSFRTRYQWKKQCPYCNSKTLEDGSNEKGICIVILICQPSSQGSRSTPPEGRHRIKTLPTTTNLLGHEIHQNRFLQRIRAIHQACPCDINWYQPEWPSRQELFKVDHAIETRDSQDRKKQLCLHSPEARRASWEPSVEVIAMTKGEMQKMA